MAEEWAAEWADLNRRLWLASGSDEELDRDLAALFGQSPHAYSASVEDCRALVTAALPGWRLHLGYGASGMFPYALLSRDGIQIVSDAPTVPLAILRSLVAAKARSAPSALPPS
ncbi:hypothetical protein CU669_08285 [Paramagnetospirillum kuznetsovii]|uniref:Uncharacterized protein n=1 Tax=Paramagnetospirillum kuznetsovii TaxID=2053833 RepID=A0A364P013_9PROT|nr:hypothetical protein [Paramagnetospirillum kuznetsovii]RAU22664.1 hypothetical protein CU669_08285 [Paramagnetospirillum kuznetsovii]